MDPLNISPLPAEVMLRAVGKRFCRNTGGGRVLLPDPNMLLIQLGSCSEGGLSAWVPVVCRGGQWHMARPCGQLSLAQLGQLHRRMMPAWHLPVNSYP